MYYHNMHISEETILAKVLPKNEDYFYEKTEVTEVAPSPTPITYSLLLSFYLQNGPIQKVYKKYNVTYVPNNFFVQIGNELYVDKEKELQTLLPSYSYFGKKELLPHFSRVKGSLISIKNLFFLRIITRKDIKNIKKIATHILYEPFSYSFSIQENTENFLKDYQIVFEINVLTSKKVKELEKFLSENEIKIPITNLLVLEKSELSKEISSYIKEKTKDWMGNSLEVSDISSFIPLSFMDIRKEPEDIILKNLSKEKQTQFQELIDTVKQLIELRYIGSLITLKNINMLRRCMLALAEKNKFKEKEHIYFARIDEIFYEKVLERVCEKRKEAYEELLSFHFPKTVSNKIQKNNLQSKGVSKGRVRGILITKESLEKKAGNIILYNPILSPDLVKYFGKIKGIVSEQGSLLSHAAIVAREMHIPVIVNADIEKLGIKMGDTVEINGETGFITRVMT